MQPVPSPEEAWRSIRPTIYLSDLAHAIGYSRQAVSTWKRVPAELVKPVAKFLDCHPRELRPDLFETEEPWQTL